MNYYEKCLEIAEQAHSGQFRRDGITPYIKHSKAVAEMVGLMLKNNETGKDIHQSIAILHDVIEDAKITSQQLTSMGIPNTIVDSVLRLTKTPNETYEAYLSIVKSDEQARLVKICDCLHNLHDDPTRNQVKKYSAALIYLLGLEEVKNDQIQR